MSEVEDNQADSNFDSNDHQPCYIYSPPSANDSVTTRPIKRRRVEMLTERFEFRSLFGGIENNHCRQLRKELFNQAWAVTDARIREVLNSANGKLLDEVSNFVQEKNAESDGHKISTGFIITGPNISSQELLFQQISCRLKKDMSGPVVVLRSADVSNLKSILKNLIRDVLRQSNETYDEFRYLEYENGRKLLNYDLKIIHNFAKRHKDLVFTIVFQDSEAYDASLIAETIILLSSWRDRIPFKLIFGIATSVDLFDERIPRAASRCVSGHLFEAEQTNTLLQRVFSRAVAGADAPLRLGTSLINALMEQQKNHAQSIQAFITSLKFAYMCHYYLDALSVLNLTSENLNSSLTYLQPEHFLAIRMLSSFQSKIEANCKLGSSKELLQQSKLLLTNDKTLLVEVEKAIKSKNNTTTRLLRLIHILNKVSLKAHSIIDLYLVAQNDCIGNSIYVIDILDSLKRMTPLNLVNLIGAITQAIHHGAPEMNLPGWALEEEELLSKLSHIQSQISILIQKCSKIGKELKSSYTIHNKSLRTTVVAQRVQLSYENLTLSLEDKEFTTLVEKLSKLLSAYFSAVDTPNEFLSEVWTFDSIERYSEVFNPHPRAAIERALSTPSDYLNSCASNMNKPPATSLIYQMYLESGSLINVPDLWTSFASVFNVSTDETVDERDILVSFYRGLADLKMLGMIKQSKRKVDHLSKLLWKGL
ncbi:Origin recognition complex subunit 3 [Erysiphe neolycopersici]|uniref:Origin recognition complex subunit 3 n=1 Tax=Erysiphe neolycopersici TaxID=212602 RepID=A0A420I1W3_9PEZI|nr:Origin recognition complex subunit 3 [Erysiphe neolycopersici]